MKVKITHYLSPETPDKSYPFSVGWGSPEVEALVEGEGQYQGVFQSYDLEQTGDCIAAVSCDINKRIIPTGALHVLIWSLPRIRAAICLLF